MCGSKVENTRKPLGLRTFPLCASYIDAPLSKLLPLLACSLCASAPLSSWGTRSHFCFVFEAASIVSVVLRVFGDPDGCKRSEVMSEYCTARL
jgi:hypothetical protein